MARLASLCRAVYDKWSAALPREVDRRIRVFAWVALVTQLANVVSGAAVRLTGSGLGCPSFPECTPGSLVVTPEMGIHGLIEFGNRMVAVLLTLICVTVFVLVVRLRRSRPELFWLAFGVALGIPAQAIIGGMSVLSGLNPYVVGLPLRAIRCAHRAVDGAVVPRIRRYRPLPGGCGASDVVGHGRDVRHRLPRRARRYRDDWSRTARRGCRRSSQRAGPRPS